MRSQTCRRSVARGSRAQPAGRRTCILAGGPSCAARVSNSPFFLRHMDIPLTLYPAAYPRPGKSEINFFPTVADALSLKMTVFSCVMLAIYVARLSAQRSPNQLVRMRATHLRLIAHQPLRNRIDLIEWSVQLFLIPEWNHWPSPAAHTGWKIANSAIPAEPVLRISRSVPVASEESSIHHTGTQQSRQIRLLVTCSRWWGHLCCLV